MDGLGRLVSVFENPTGLNYQTTYSYDALGNLLGVVQAGSRNRTFSYNSLSELSSAINPESGTISYAYNNDGTMLTRIAPLPNQTGTATVTTTYTPDALHRVTQKSYSDGTPTASFLFDVGYTGFTPVNGVGRMSLASTANTQTNFQYDPMGRIASRGVCVPSNCATGGGAGFFYVYDLAGSLIQFNDGVFTWPQYFVPAYDGAGRLKQLTSTYSDSLHPATYFTADLTNGYWPDGALRKAALGNGLTETSFYDKRLQLCRKNVNSTSVLLTACVNAPPTGNVLDMQYGFNLAVSDNGNVASWSATGNQAFTRSYVYDALNRVSTFADTAASQPCKGLSWTYDAWGNRTDQTLTSGTCGTFHQAVDTNNRLLGAPYQYDAAGNMTHDATHSYTYDAENRLVSMDGGAATNIYDAFGARAEHKVGTAVYEYIYDQDGHIGWEKLNGVLNRTYLWAGGRLFADFYEGTTYFAHQDHLGSTRLLTRLDKTIRECDDYYPYGESNACTGLTTGTPLKFTGKERDTESGLDNFTVRYFSSSLGRFMRPDDFNIDQEPADPQSWNLYSYVRNNPLRNTDPTGNACVSEDGGKTYHDDKSGGQSCAAASKPQEVRVTATPWAHFWGDKAYHQLESQQFEAWMKRNNIKWSNAEIPVGPIGEIGGLVEAGIEELSTMAKFSGLLREAAAGKGNFGLGTATAEEAAEAGKAWVGEGATVATDGKTLVSADGLRVYRPPSMKPSLGKVQANFEQKVARGGQPISNGHLDIK